MAVASLTSDLSKHPETSDDPELARLAVIGALLLMHDAPAKLVSAWIGCFSDDPAPGAP